MCQNVHLFQCCMFLLHSEIMLDQQHQQANQFSFFFLMIFAAVLKRSCDHVLVLLAEIPGPNLSCVHLLKSSRWTAAPQKLGPFLIDDL